MRSDRTGIDTNILVYAIDSADERKHKIAVEILEDLHENPERYSVALQVIAELIYVTQRKYPEMFDLAVKLALILLKHPKVDRPKYSEDIIGIAISAKGNFWDAVLAYTYLASGVKKILTENVEDFANLPIEAENPFAKTGSDRLRI